MVHDPPIPTLNARIQRVRSLRAELLRLGERERGLTDSEHAWTVQRGRLEAQLQTVAKYIAESGRAHQELREQIARIEKDIDRENAAINVVAHPARGP